MASVSVSACAPGPSGLVQRHLPGRRDLLALAAARPQRYPCLLESAAHGTPQGRWDILLAFPRERIVLDASQVLRHGDDTRPGGNFLRALDADWLAGRQVIGNDDGLPFHGGWALWLGYELAAQIEPRLRLATGTAGEPVAMALRCPAAILCDHVHDCTIVLAEAGQAGLVEAMLSDLSTGGAASVPPLPPLLRLDEDSPQRFLDAVARIHGHVADGDVFQVNLSRGWHARFSAPPQAATLHAALRHANPAPFAALWQQPGWCVASSSPERLVEVRSGRVQTRPIAGTRPRLPGEDGRARIAELRGDPKERAEHIMLVDLERNDLGRVCVPGSVLVDELMTVESYTHVHHLVSNVRGRLRAQVTPGQVMAALFPGGSITGCPKVRCMQIIADLEGERRGSYTGAVGYLDRNGDMDLNILIRTLDAVGSDVHLRAGAGIVVDSDAASELHETRAKARGLLRALGVDA